MQGWTAGVRSCARGFVAVFGVGLVAFAAGSGAIPALSAELSPAQIVAMRFPAGWGAGNAPAVYGGWDGGEGGTILSKFYVSMWIRIAGTDILLSAGGRL